MKFYSKPYVKAFYAGNYFARLTAGAVLSIGLLSFPSCSDDDPVEEVGNGISSSQTVLVEEGNMPMAGTITAQYADFVGGNDLSKLVDGNERTMYTTSHNAFSICYEAESPVIVNYYALTSSTNIETMDPYTWTLSGSNDAQTWDVLDRQAGQRFRTRLYTMEYEFNNATAYRYYQLEIEDNNGGDQTSIGEWILSEGALDPTKPYSIEVGTENMLNPLGRISSEFNDSPVGEKIDKLVDGNASTNFVTSHNKFYIQWNQLDNIKTYGTYYTLTAALGDVSTAPRAWKIYSSENGSQWELQDEQTNQTFEGGETKRFSFKENTDYSKTAPSHLYYKLEIEDNNGASTTQIAEWTVGYECRNLGDVMYFAENFTRSDRTPMGVMYQDLPETTDEQLAILENPEIEPDATAYGSDKYWNPREVTLYPFGEPQPADVNQHMIGNCCALAVLASYAYLYPDFIENIIHENPDGTYTVDMFDPKGQAIKVGIKPTFVHPEEWRENPTYNWGVSGKHDVVTWSNILEKAMMKWQYVFKINENMEGIYTDRVHPLFSGTGEGFNIYPCNGINITPEQVKCAVLDALKQGMIVTGGFSQNGIPAPDGSGSTISAHEWTMMVSANVHALFAMRNPWGSNGDDAADGVLNIFAESGMIPTMDIRIMPPGFAGQFGSGRTTPYDVPKFAPSPLVRVNKSWTGKIQRATGKVVK